MKTLILILTLGISSTVFAQKIIEKTVKTDRNQSILLDLDFADLIKITGWDKDEVYLKASVNINNNEDNDAFAIDVDHTSGILKFSSEIENMKELSKKRICYEKDDDGNTITYNGNHIEMDISFEIFLPKNQNFDIKTISGDIEITNMLNQIQAKSISGFVDATISQSSNSSINAKTITGGIYTDHEYRPRRSELKDYRHIVGGKVDFDINSGGTRVELETISGDIYIRK